MAQVSGLQLQAELSCLYMQQQSICSLPLVHCPSWQLADSTLHEVMLITLMNHTAHSISLQLLPVCMPSYSQYCPTPPLLLNQFELMSICKCHSHIHTHCFQNHFLLHERTTVRKADVQCAQCCAATVPIPCPGQSPQNSRRFFLMCLSNLD